MNKTIRRLKQEIEQRGGQIHIDENLPDDVAELFLREVLSCPDCVAQPRGEDNRRERSSGH
jgi:hypothetical protein